MNLSVRTASNPKVLDVTTNGRNISSFWMIFLFAVFFFKPTPTGILGPEIGMKIPDVIYTLIFIAFWIRHGHLVKKGTIPILLLLLFILEALSLFKGVLLHNIVLGDMIEVIRPLIFLLAFYVGSALVHVSLSEKIKRSFMLILLIFIIFSIILFFDFYGIKNYISNFYEVGKSRGISGENISNIWRLSSTFTNPNYFGMVSGVISSFMFYKLINSFKFLTIFYLLVFVSFILISGSRTALAATLVTFVLIVLFDLFSGAIKRKKSLKIYFVIFLFFVAFLPSLFHTITDVLWRFSNTDNMSESFGARLDMWEIVFSSIENNPLIGLGSNKSEIKSIDNNYLMILYKNGILGLLLVMGIFIYSFKIVIKLYKAKISSPIVRQQNRDIAILLLSSIIIIMIGMLTAVPFYMSHISIPFFLLLGYASKSLKVHCHAKY